MKAPLLASLLTVIAVTPSHAQDWSLHTEALNKSVFHLQTTDGHCSAILINDKDHFLLTAAHCVNDPAKKEGGSITVDDKHAEVVKWNALLDLAVIRAKEVGGIPVGIRSVNVKPGTPVMAAGHGFAALRLKHTFGWVSDPEDASLRQVGKKFYFSMTGVVGGYSGGAVLDSEKRLISVVQAGTESGFMVGAPTDTIKDFASDYWPK